MKPAARKELEALPDNVFARIVTNPSPGLHGPQDAKKHRSVRLKRNKALPDNHGIAIAALDGHESHASYLRHCPGCLERIIHAGKTDRTQFYHRQVTLMLLPGGHPGGQPIRLLLDFEPPDPQSSGLISKYPSSTTTCIVDPGIQTTQ